jgi:hypothetical protein
MSVLIQIAGVPRSGTAFLAAFLSTHPKCVSNHELVATDSNWKDTLNNQLERWDYVVDSTTYGWLPKATIEGSKRIGLTRKPEESSKCATKAFGYAVDACSMDFCYDQVLEWSKEGLKFDYSEVFNAGILKAIWVYCFGNEEFFSEEKAKFFISMNIQRMNPEIVFSVENGQKTLKEVI